MGLYFTRTLLACVVLLLLFEETSSSTIWSAPVQAKGFDSYLDVIPVKYNVPSGLSHMILSFQSGRNDKKCPAKQIYIHVQYGGLPLVIESNETFPSNFKVDEPTLVFSMVKEQRISFSVMWPPPGPWFIVAYTEKEDKDIRQKGLGGDDDCIYFYKSTMEPDFLVTSTVIDYKDAQEFTIRHTGMLFRFKIPTSTMSFNVSVIECDPDPCDLILTYASYDRTAANVLLCNGSVDCVMYVESPPLGDMQFLEIRYNGLNGTSQKITFLIIPTECSDSHQCYATPKLDRVETSGPFNCAFGFMHEHSLTLYTELSKAPYIVIPFETLDQTDVGGTLGWRMVILNSAAMNSKVIVQICGTLLFNHLPDVTGHVDLCADSSHGIKHNFSLPSTDKPSFYVPYPKVGIWHIMLQITCFDAASEAHIKCPIGAFANMELKLQPCLNGDCSDRGTCSLGSISSDLVMFAACRCDAKYQGYACTDDTNAQSSAIQIVGACLLTLSNLFFVPAIVIAVRRRFFVEAFVYFYNMFFSTFYHACDGIRIEKYRMCITKYDVLQAADFFASACSLWITLVAMSRIKFPYVMPVLQVVGPFGLLIGVVYDKTSLYVIAVPIACGLVVIAASWGYKMYKRRKLYPSWRRYLMFLLPGLVLAAIGASVFSFLETEDNYQYVHSVWHTCIALSICLFLPPRNMENYKKCSSETLTCEILDACRPQCSRRTGEETNTGFINSEDQ